MCKVLNGHGNLDRNIFGNIKTGLKKTRDDFTPVKGRSRLYGKKYYFFPRGPYMSGINYQLIVCILVVVIYLRTV